ncbi:MAG TPA: tetratricopeptide repeat protein [Methylomirabilota bacterium]|nr:tetratricopeptide repeat protein [Methylomirabilota bacterium]
MTAERITTAGFLSQFVMRHTKMPDRPFCWVLGSGASIQSGIPTGGSLAMQWLKELHEMEDFSGSPLDQWATPANLNIKSFDFTKAASFYPFIYQRRFRDYREEGYAFLEHAMEMAEPSYGYSVLAQIMALSQHKVAVTTNFDNLIADAISTYTRGYPLVCGHESLTGFIRPNLKRPLIAKIHRDLLLNPKSEPDEIEKLPPEWDHALQVIFDNNTPIVIGYGGNDGSLMGFFKRIKPIKGGIFWCHRLGSEPDPQIHEIVEHHHGRLVPILGFDELMLQLWEKLQLPSPIPDLLKTHDKRVLDFQRQFEDLNKKLKHPGESRAAEAELKEVRAAASAAVERMTKEKDWWAWQLKANAEPAPDKAEALYHEGLKDFPDSAELTGNFAIFLHETRKDYDQAERLYRKALELDPKHANNIGNFAFFVESVRGHHDEAERLYRRALELDPRHANHTGNLALFMANIRHDNDEAERLYRKAVELDPKHPVILSNFAYFLWDVRQDHAEAERLYRKAIELGLNRATDIGNFAIFMENVHKNFDEAERFYRKALELDPTHADHTGNLALFMANIRKDPDEAERLYRKALELDPKHANNTGNFAGFMAARGNLAEADRLYRVSLGLASTPQWIKDQHAAFLKEHPEFDKPS